MFSETENTSISISPVKKVNNPVISMLGNDSIMLGEGEPRLSTIPGITAGAGLHMRRVDQRHRESNINIAPKLGARPFRVNINSGVSLEQKLMQKVQEYRQQDLVKRKKESKGKAKRTSPRKAYPDPVASSTLLEDISSGPSRAQKSVYEMLHDAKKKEDNQTVADNESLSGSELSSLYEDIAGDETTGAVADTEEEEITVTRGSDKENTNTNNTSPKKLAKPAVTKSYKGRNNKTAVENITKYVNFDATRDSPVKKEKETKKVRHNSK